MATIPVVTHPAEEMTPLEQAVASLVRLEDHFIMTQALLLAIGKSLSQAVVAPIPIRPSGPSDAQIQGWRDLQITRFGAAKVKACVSCSLVWPDSFSRFPPDAGYASGKSALCHICHTEKDSAKRKDIRKSTSIGVAEEMLAELLEQGITYVSPSSFAASYKEKDKEKAGAV